MKCAIPEDAETAADVRDLAVITLAARLKQARRDQGLSVRQVCEAAGITSKSVAWRAENGRDVAFSVAARLAAALGVSLDGTVECKRPNLLTTSRGLHSLMS